MHFDVTVIGAGVSGLNAATILASAGKRVCVLEQKPFAGGRTYSKKEIEFGYDVDNGQHILMGCYDETLEYIRRIGSSNRIHVQPSLRVDFFDLERGFAALHCPRLPAPFHLLAGFLSYKLLSVRERLSILRALATLGMPEPAVTEKLGGISVSDWLSQLRQTKHARMVFWDILVVGTMNGRPEDVSALLFQRVLKKIFLGRRTDSSLALPKTGLSPLLIEPAVEFLRGKGAEIRFNARTEEINLSQGEEAVESRFKVLANGISIHTMAVISAVPWYALGDIELPDELSETGFTSIRGQFTASPIFTVNVLLKRPIIEHPVLGIIGGTVQWIFNRTALDGKDLGEDNGGQYLTFVISAARALMPLTEQEILKHCFADLSRINGDFKPDEVAEARVYREKRATFVPEASIEKFRPAAKTPLRGFFLAGDWTATGYPATIEGAALSGKIAATEALAFLP